MRREAIVAAALLAALAIGGASAQTAPADPLAPGAAARDAAPRRRAKPREAQAAKPQRKPRAPALAVTVNNKRSVGLVELTVGSCRRRQPEEGRGPARLRPKDRRFT